MTTALLVTGLALLVLISGLLGYRAVARGWRSRAAWYGLALLFTGLWLAGHAGEEALAYGFGIALMLAVPALLVAGAGAALGAALRSRGRTPPPT